MPISTETSPARGQVEEESSLPVAEPIDFSEDDYRVQNILEKLLQVRRLVGRALVRWPSGESELREFHEHESVEVVRFLLRSAYRRGNVVIVGRGGQATLKGMPGTQHATATFTVIRVLLPVVVKP